MTKAELVSIIAEKTGMPKVEIMTILEAYIKEVKTSLIEGEPVWVRGFGSFNIKKRRAKTGQNITKGVSVHIPEHFIPAFKPSKEFVNEVKASGKKPKEWGKGKPSKKQ
jgi:DNA-binding protein HU-beta